MLSEWFFLQLLLLSRVMVLSILDLPILSVPVLQVLSSNDSMRAITESVSDLREHIPDLLFPQLLFLLLEPIQQEYQQDRYPEGCLLSISGISTDSVPGTRSSKVLRPMDSNTVWIQLLQRLTLPIPPLLRLAPISHQLLWDNPLVESSKTSSLRYPQFV